MNVGGTWAPKMRNCENKLGRRAVGIAWLAAVWASTPCPPVFAAETLHIGGTGAALGVVRNLAKAFKANHPSIDIVVPESVGSSGGIKGVMTGKFALGLSARPLTAEEQAAGVRYVSLGDTPVVLAVSSKIGTRPALTRAELAAVYGLKRTEWPNGQRLRLVHRPETEIAYLTLIRAFPELAPLADRARAARGAILALTDQESFAFATANVGFLSLGPLSAIISENLDLTPLALDGNEPTLDALARGDYKMKVQVGFVVPGTLPDLSRRFLEFTQSDLGQGILRASGFLLVER